LTTKPITLRLMRQVYNPTQSAFWADIYKQWNAAYPNITIQEETVPYGTLQSKLEAYVAAGNPPDIIMGKGDFVPFYVYSNIALNLSQYLTDAYQKDIVPATWSQQSVGGNLYCMPYSADNVLMFYNKDMTDAAGITPPYQGTDLSQGFSWDEAHTFWTKLNSYLNPQGGDPTRYALAPETYGTGGAGGSYWFDSIFIRSMGDANAPKDSDLYKTFIGVSPDGLQATGYVDTPQAIQGMTFYQNLFKEKLSPPAAVTRAFFDGKAATFLNSGGVEAQARNPANKVTFKWSSTPLPHGNMLFNNISSDCLFASAKTQYPAEVAAWLAFMNNDTNRIAWSRIGGVPPARLSLFAQMPEYDTAPFNMFLADTKAGYAPPVTPGYIEYFNAMNQAVKDIAAGADPAARLHEVASQIDGLLATYKK
jgi:multiple sugar transport system substrate-binding protein